MHFRTCFLVKTSMPVNSPGSRLSHPLPVVATTLIGESLCSSFMKSNNEDQTSRRIRQGHNQASDQASDHNPARDWISLLQRVQRKNEPELKSRDWIQRRSCASWHGQWRGCQQKLPLAQFFRSSAQVFQIAVVENMDAHGMQSQ